MPAQQKILPNENDGVDDFIDDVPYTGVSERKVLIQTYDYAVRTLMEMVIEGDLALDPDYQRHYRWTDDKASRFIESVSLNIPVPVIYLAEEANGTFTVIDGQQRLTSLLRFLKPSELESIFPTKNPGELLISDLKIRPDLNQKRFAELPQVEKSAIAKRPIRCIVVLNESDSTLKFEVFERLNTGSLSLTDQEVRNCVYRGTFNTLLKRLALNDKFREMAALPATAKNTMKDAELVLRFFAYKDLTEKTTYADNYTEFLNTYMEDNREISASREKQLEKIFLDTVDTIYSTLGPGKAFRKPLNQQDPFAGFANNLINGAIFESQMIAFASALEHGKITNNPKEAIKLAFSKESYWSALFSGTAQKAKVLRRSAILTDLLME